RASLSLTIPRQSSSSVVLDSPFPTTRLHDERSLTESLPQLPAKAPWRETESHPAPSTNCPLVRVPSIRLGAKSRFGHRRPARPPADGYTSKPSSLAPSAVGSSLSCRGYRL